MIGIYSITNTKNNKRYIGKSVHIEQRWKEHLTMLNKNTHHSYKLQEAWNNEDDKTLFKFKTIKECDEDELESMEIYYIHTYDSYRNGYNCTNIDSDLAKKIQNNIKANKESYDEFIKLVSQLGNKLIIEGKIYSKRLLNQHYKYIEYKKVIKLINYVLNNFNVDEIKYMTLSYMLKKELFLNLNHDGIVYAFYIKKNEIEYYSRDAII